MSPLIIGSADDEHAAAVAGALRARDSEPVYVDVAKLEATAYSLSQGTLTLHQATGDIRMMLDSSTRGWIRRLAPPHWRRSVTLGSKEAAIRGAWTALLAAVAGALEVAWLTPLDRLLMRENKVLQACAADRLGIPTPALAIVSDPALIPLELGERLVVKPLGSAVYTEREGGEQVVWTQEVSRDSPVLDRLAGAPFVIQSRLDADRHLRVVTVDRQSWVCELTASDLPLDWRREERAHRSFVAASAPMVGRDAVRLATALGIGYSSQDWIVANGVAYFVDLNPAGQWLFLPNDVACSVTNAIASWLTP